LFKKEQSPAVAKEDALLYCAYIVLVAVLTVKVIQGR